MIKMNKSQPKELDPERVNWSQLELKLVQLCPLPNTDRGGKVEVLRKAHEFAAEYGFDFYMLVEPLDNVTICQGITTKTQVIRVKERPSRCHYWEDPRTGLPRNNPSGPNIDEEGYSSLEVVTSVRPNVIAAKLVSIHYYTKKNS